MGSSNILSMIDDGEPRRDSLRRRVMLAARLSNSSRSFSVRIRDVSASGARIEGQELPAMGTVVLLTRGSFSAYGTLIWRDGASGGIQFEEPLDEACLMDDLKGLADSTPEQEPYRRTGLNRSAHARYSNGEGWIDKPPGSR